MTTPARPDVHEYADYRLFLQDCYAWLKQSRRGFSLRKLSVKKPKEALKGPGKNNPIYSAQFLHTVISGKIDMPLSMVEPLGVAFGLSDSERLFLHRLVRFHVDKDPEGRMNAFKRMSWRAEFRDAHGIGSRDRLDFISHGFIGDVYLMTALPDFKADADWISQRTYFPVNKSQVKAALETLQKLGLITMNDTGDVSRTDAPPPTPTTGEEALFRIYHMEQADKARKILEYLPTQDREFVTFGLSRFSRDNFRHFLAELSESVEQALESAVARWADQGGDEHIVAQFNMQVFPLTPVDPPNDCDNKGGDE